MITLALIQHAPAFLNLPASLNKIDLLVHEAAQNGANLVVMGESFLSGYPAWIDSCKEAAIWDHPKGKDLFAQMHASSLAIPSPEFDQLCAIAKSAKVLLCLGVNEKVLAGPGNGTLYNTLLFIDEQGTLINHHRKLMPTYTEKLVYGLGDGQGLQSMDWQNCRVGGLICWEHFMPLARQTMHNAGEHIHIAVWPTVHDMHQVASRHYAFEGRCYVVAVGQLLLQADLPEGLSCPKTDNPYVLRGGSCIIGPDGQFIVEPLFEEEAIIYQSIDPQGVYRERMTLDSSGHYQRRDVFDFSHNPERLG